LEILADKRNVLEFFFDSVSTVVTSKNDHSEDFEW